MPGKYLSHVPTRSALLVPAVVIEGDLERARYWHQQVHVPYIAQDASRLDRKWNWPRLLSWTSLIERAAGCNSAFLQLNVPTPNGTAFPAGQILVSDGYPYFPVPEERSVFLWYWQRHRRVR